MDSSVLFAGGIVLLVLFGPWLLLWRANSARKRERDEDGQRWRELTSRIYALENAVEKMQAQRSAAGGKSVEPETSERPVVVEIETTPEPSPSVRVAHDWGTQKTAEPVAAYLPSLVSAASAPPASVPTSSGPPADVPFAPPPPTAARVS